MSHDPDLKYPDRTASQMENSNYLSQLRGGFEQMILQNENVMKQKQKEILLQEEAGSAPHSHHEHVIRENQWRHHVPPDEPMPEAEVFHTPLRIPVGEPREYAPAGTTPMGPMDELRSRSNRKASQRNSPVIQEAPSQHFEIGTPRSRSPRKSRFKIAHDVDSEAQQAHEMIIDDEEMKAARDDELRVKFVEASSLMLQDAQNQSIDDIMTGRGDKRREVNTDPKPVKPKAKTTAWTQQGHARYTPNEPIPKAPPPKAEPKTNSTPASSSTDTPYAKAKAKAEAKAKAGPAPEETRSKAIPVKKTKPKHTTEKVVLDTYDEWFEKSLGFLMDQISVRRLSYDTYMPISELIRPKPKPVKKPKKQYKPEMIDMLLRFDGKL